MEIGMKYRVIRQVTEDVTAAALNSEMAPVLATPWLIAFLEEAAAKCAAPELDAAQTTLGTQVNIRHLAATPVGMEVTCEAELTAIDRRRLVFDVRAWDADDPICEGTHERFIVDRDSFLKKAYAKLNKG